MRRTSLGKAENISGSHYRRAGNAFPRLLSYYTIGTDGVYIYKLPALSLTLESSCVQLPRPRVCMYNYVYLYTTKVSMVSQNDLSHRRIGKLIRLVLVGLRVKTDEFWGVYYNVIIIYHTRKSTADVVYNMQLVTLSRESSSAPVVGIALYTRSVFWRWVSLHVRVLISFIMTNLFHAKVKNDAL